MKSITQVQTGITNYIDKYLIPKIPQKTEQILKGSIIAIAINKLPVLIENNKKKFMLLEMGLINEQNDIDTDLLFSILKERFEKTGKVEFDIPLIGLLGLDAEAITQLETEINSV